MSDPRQTTPTPPQSSNSLVFIVGGLVVAVGVLAYLFIGGGLSISGSGNPPDISIENTTTLPPIAAPATSEPAAPAPAEPAPATP